MRILLLDNYDSFTFNLFQQIRSLGADVIVRKNDEVDVAGIRRLNADAIVISPGPGGPEESGVCLDAIRTFAEEIPILGVCLGHQCIASVYGSKIERATHVMHGKTSEIVHNGSGLMKEIPSPMIAARYHSLIVSAVPPGFRLMCWTKQDLIMGIAHESLPVFGVQFHPESFLTKHGDRLMKNFLSHVHARA